MSNPTKKTRIPYRADESLLDVVRCELNVRKGEWHAIAEQSGLSYEWVAKMYRGFIKEPSILKVERLAAALFPYGTRPTLAFYRQDATLVPEDGAGVVQERT